MESLIGITNFFKSGNIMIIRGIYFALLLVIFLLMKLLVKGKRDVYIIELTINLLLVVCTLIGLFVFDKAYISKILVGAVMILISLVLFVKLDKILSVLRDKIIEENKVSKKSR